MLLVLGPPESAYIAAPAENRQSGAYGHQSLHTTRTPHVERSWSPRGSSRRLRSTSPLPLAMFRKSYLLERLQLRHVQREVDLILHRIIRNLFWCEHRSIFPLQYPSAVPRNRSESCNAVVICTSTHDCHCILDARCFLLLLDLQNLWLNDGTTGLGFWFGRLLFGQA